MPKAKNKRPKTSTAPTTLPADQSATQPRTLRPRPAPAAKAADVPTKLKPRQCTICGRPRLGHPRQCKDGPSAGSRLATLDDAANEREAEILAQEAQFVAGQGLQGEDQMDVDDDATGGGQESASASGENAAAIPPDGAARTPPLDQTLPPQSNARAAPDLPLAARSQQSAELSDAPPANPPLDQTLPPQSNAPAGPGVPLAARSQQSAELSDGPPANPPLDQTLPPHSNAPAAPDLQLAARSQQSADHADHAAAKPAPVTRKEKVALNTSSESEPLEGGLRSTPAGDLPLPMKRSSKTKEEYNTRKASKKTTDMFTSMAMTGDLLASRVPGWAFCIFVPMARRGEMRSWTSTKVRGDVPELPAEIRQLIFQRLEPFREQADDERELVLLEKENLIKEKDSQLEHYKRLAEEAEQRALDKEREAEALRDAYALANALVD